MTGGTTTPTQRSSRLMEPNHFSIMSSNRLNVENKERCMEARLRHSTRKTSQDQKREETMQHCSNHSASFLAWNLSFIHWKSNKTHLLLKSIVLTKNRVSTPILIKSQICLPQYLDEYSCNSHTNNTRASPKYKVRILKVMECLEIFFQRRSGGRW